MASSARLLQHDTHGKALSLNLDHSIYGTLAEIGAGQEVARWFLAVGGASGTVELGLPIDTANKNPCAIVAPATSLIDSTGTLTNTACNGYFNYNRSNRIRTSAPTERLSLHSTYFQRLEFAASYAYSSADMNAPLGESFNGLIPRSSIRQETVTGPGRATSVSNVADFSVTLHLSEHFRFVDTFRLSVRGEIICRTNRSPIFSRQQCDIFTALGFLSISAETASRAFKP